MLTGRYGEKSGGGGGARVCDVETGDLYEVLWQLEEHSSSKVGIAKGPPFAIFFFLLRCTPERNSKTKSPSLTTAEHTMRFALAVF